MGGGANLFVKDVIPWAHFNLGIFNGFGLLFLLSEKFLKKNLRSRGLLNSQSFYL